MTTHNPRLTQLLTLGLHLQETQSGPIMLRESLESVYVYPFFAKKFQRLSTPAEYIRNFAEACVTSIILYCSPVIFPGFLNKTLPFLDDKLSVAVMYVVLVSATPQISSANVASKHPPTLQSGFLLTVSTPNMRNNQRQGHTPPQGAVSNCFPRRLQPIVTLFYRHCHGCWVTATLN